MKVQPRVRGGEGGSDGEGEGEGEGGERGVSEGEGKSDGESQVFLRVRLKTSRSLADGRGEPEFVALSKLSVAKMHPRQMDCPDRILRSHRRMQTFPFNLVRPWPRVSVSILHCPKSSCALTASS